jgi:hypothetical protein
MTDESERLRKKAAELLERAFRRDASLSPEEDAAVLALLKQAQELGIRDRQEHRAQHTTD